MVLGSILRFYQIKLNSSKNYNKKKRKNQATFYQEIWNNTHLSQAYIMKYF